MGRVDNNSCKEGTVAGGLLGGALGGVLSKKENWIGGQSPLGIVGGSHGRVPGGRWLKCPLLTPSTPISCILKESKENHSWQPAHASASNLKTVQFFLLITTGMVILQWLGRILNTHYNSREQAADLIDGGDMSSCWTNERWTGKISTREFGGADVTKRALNMVLNTIHNVVRIVLLVMMKPAKSFCLMVKNTLTSSPVLVGYAMI